MKKLTGPLKIHGGKHDLASWIIGLMPPRCKNPNNPDPDDPGFLHYCEPYAGGLSVLLAMDPEGVSEVVGDKHPELTNFWRVMQREPVFGQFRGWMDGVPFSEVEFLEAGPNYVADPKADVLRAVNFFIRCRQSLAGRMKSFAPVTRNRTRRGMNEQVSAWLNAVEGLPAVHARLKRVVILNDDAINVIRKQDGPRTLFYLDPTYLHETRATTGEYEHEMDRHDHAELLTELKAIKGRFLLSGHHSPLYDGVATAKGWHCHEKKINNHAADGKTKRVMTEVCWTNFA